MKPYQHAATMVCPKCGAKTTVLDSRGNETRNSIRRRRQCDGCANRFTTQELIEDERLGARTRLSARVANLSQEIIELQKALKEFK